MANSGGRYVVDDSGKRQLVERTGMTPKKPARKSPPKQTKEVSTDEVSEKVDSGSD